VPTTIALERATNPFMRAASTEALAALRSAKDNFRG
jgi:hydroxyacylglutathione hydrolase